ncbi:MAG: hypothetical protein M3434_11595, partial [Gemmatimonadota bacterium]|nr:hypothetical protein [Gemmatimonadota bacterium]
MGGIIVKFLSSREVRNTPGALWDALETGASVALTANGKSDSDDLAFLEVAAAGGSVSRLAPCSGATSSGSAFRARLGNHPVRLARTSA